ncbi:hypothetical protein V0R50_25720 [Pseudomonas sp. 148P]|uniref:Diguanylate cyclase n=1 Tax=Pseudomonas ulcerans TaxID=3115852 RepID=A0ABU7HYM4_9PSED|nr:MULTISPECIES: hypothetical protein [unclassified Pseudomonas]MEE1925209.1 hypothetical protein [Pseudomonas sp. 147P]MEE1936635.1 hypothetical protein [Pseudomonas sp. 148P]
MPLSRRNDLVCSLLLIAALFLFVCLTGDTLYIGAWYFLAIPLATLLPGLIWRTPALFLSGSAIAAITSLLSYMAVMANLKQPEGLLVLGHLFSAPGLLAGAAFAAWLLRSRVRVTLPWLVAGTGFLAAALGFLAAQLLVCSSVMYCGALSWWA